MLFHCSVHFRNSFKLCINSDPSRRNWVGQFPLALSLRTPTNTIPPTMSFSDRRRRRRDSGEGRGVEEKYIPTESKLWQQSILFSVNWKSECGRDVVLETIVLVSRALETNFMWSWSWSWYWELKSWPSSWSFQYWCWSWHCWYWLQDCSAVNMTADQLLFFSAWHCWLGHLTRKNRPRYDL